MRDHQATFPIATLCRVLRVSPSGFYAWSQRRLSRRAVQDVRLTATITASHARSDGTYGAPRVLHDLREVGERVGRKRVARLMRTAGLRGVSRRRFVTTTDHHSDHGTQYTSIAFGERCEAMGVRPSRGSVGDCYDNALCESFFATLECELMDRRTFRSQTDARAAIFTFIEGWYNPHRRHSTLGYVSPITYERQHANAA